MRRFSAHSDWPGGLLACASESCWGCWQDADTEMDDEGQAASGAVSAAAAAQASSGRLLH